jgi:pimeloyl-ACP methyl ester carboxylesterase
LLSVNIVRILPLLFLKFDIILGMAPNKNAHDLKIPSSSGLQLAAIFNPPTTTEKTPPFVILLHGNTGWKEEEHLATLAETLAENGIAAIRFDAPGSGKSDGSWEKDYRASNYLSAVKSVYDYAIENLQVDPQRAGIWGHSMGGMIAVHAASRNKNMFQALCGCELSPGEMSKYHGNDIKEWRERGGVEVETEIFGKIWLPVDYFIDREQFNTAREIAKLHIPLLLLAGLHDQLVTHQSVRHIFEAANEPKKYLEHPMDHFYKRNPRTLAKVNREVVHFFLKNLR